MSGAGGIWTHNPQIFSLELPQIKLQPQSTQYLVDKKTVYKAYYLTNAILSKRFI